MKTSIKLFPTQGTFHFGSVALIPYILFLIVIFLFVIFYLFFPLCISSGFESECLQARLRAVDARLPLLIDGVGLRIRGRGA